MSEPQRERPSALARWSGLAFRALLGCAIIAITGFGVATLHQRAGADASIRASEPLPVQTDVVRLEPGYAEVRNFAGRVEPARSTSLAFERSGRLISVSADEGDSVVAGTVVARLDTIELENSRAQLVATRDAQIAALELARLTNDRQAALTDLAASAQRRDEARLGMAQAKARLAATAAALARIEIDIAKSELRAPFAGTVAARAMDEGAIVAPGTTVLDLLEVDAAQARIGLSPDVAATLSVGAQVELTDGDVAYPAELVALRPDLDTGSRTLTALFDIIAPTPPPSGAVVRLATERIHATPGSWIPLTALTEDANGLWSVFVVSESGATSAARREAVRVAHVDGERAFVTGNLRDGDIFVDTGVSRVIPDQTVRIVSAD